jgi:hypothetical protein
VKTAESGKAAGKKNLNFFAQEILVEVRGGKGYPLLVLALPVWGLQLPLDLHRFFRAAKR